MPSPENRKDTVYQHAILLVSKERIPIRAAIRKTNDDVGFKVDKYTLSRKLNVRQNSKTAKPGHTSVLNSEQEMHIASTCRHYAFRGVPLVKEEISDFVFLACGHIPSICARFKNKRPGRHWVNAFMKINNLNGTKPNRQETERYGCTNADVLTTHISNLSELYRRFDIDAT